MTTARRGADLVVDALLAACVRHLFTVSGNHVLSIYDAVAQHGGIDLIHTRHEAAAVHMADAWGRLTGTPGVALVTGGPGHANALSALYGALMAESPVLLLSGHAPRGELRRGAFQEMDQVAMAKPVSLAAWRADTPKRLGLEIATALLTAEACGPVHLSLPSDLLEARVPASAPAPPFDRARARGRQRSSRVPRDLRTLLSALQEAKRPLLLCGPAMGRGESWKAVQELATVTGAPALVIESPRGVNDPALHAAPRCFREADLIVLLGKSPDYSLRFAEPPTFDPKCRWAAVGLRGPARLRSRRFEVRIETPAPDVVERLIELTRELTWKKTSWADEVEHARRWTPADWPDLRRSSTAPIHPLRVCAALQPLVDAGAVFVSDGGEFGQWAQAGIEARTRLINGLSGSIGSALPMAIAAKLVHPDRTVVTTLGDGTFGFHALELDTALRCRLPVVAVVGNDARWNAEYQLQLRQYGAGRAIGCELLPTRYDLLADALGAYGELVERPEDLEPALARAVSSGRPACLNVMIEGVAAPTFAR
jgi:acetolactate synthase-1/2/3 large subunit